MTIGTLTIYPFGDGECVRVELDDRAQTRAFTVQRFDSLEVHLHEANRRQLTGLEPPPKLLNRDLSQLRMRMALIVHEASVAQSRDGR